MEKRLPVILGDALSHKKQRLQKKCKRTNFSGFDCKLKYSDEKRHSVKHFDNKENLKCGVENQLNSEKKLEKEVSEEQEERGEDWFRYLHDAGNSEVGFLSSLCGFYVHEFINVYNICIILLYRKCCLL